MYLTYTEYQNMGGTLEETAFNDLELEAESLVDWYTFNRLQKDTNYPDRLKQCMYRLIKLAEERQAALSLGESATGESELTGAAITSRSNDGVSISYNAMSAKDVFDITKGEMKDVIERYLNGVVNELGRKVLYRGFYPGE